MEPLNSVELTKRLAGGWYQRAKVRSELDLNLDFDKNKEDFLPELLPFHQHPLFINQKSALKSKVLSCGWIIYNAKTIAIEMQIVNPVCNAMLMDKFAGLEDPLLKQLISETMVDEAFHIHLCSLGNEKTKQEREIQFKIPPFAFVQKMRKLQDDYSEEWQKSLIQLVTSIVTEIYITDYLELVTKEQSHQLQPLNSLIVKTHRSDELAHGRIFHLLAEKIYSHLSTKQQQFIGEVIQLPMLWLADPEFELWADVLKQIQFPNAEKIIRDCQSEYRAYLPENEGVLELRKLITELGILID